MALEIRVPRLGESVVEATVGSWRKRVGETVAVGDVLVELETDKVNVETPAPAAGVLTRIVALEGVTVQADDLLAELDAVGADGATPTTPTQAVAATPAAPLVAPVVAPAPAPTSPAARAIAAETGVDLASVVGSGRGGRVTKEDVVAASAPSAPPVAAPVAPMAAPVAPPPPITPAAPAAVATSAPPPATGKPETRVRLSRRRQVIAQRLVEVQQVAAMLTTFNEVDMSRVIDVRKRRREAFQKQHGVSLGFMSFFTKAVIGALKAQPLLNAEIQGDEIVMKRYYDIGVAVSTDAGLVVPVVRDADRLTFAQIEQAVGDLANRARNNALKLDELQGGTFTITNGGIFGSLLSTPILNPPQVGILGMHKIEERPIAVGGEVVIRPMMYLALSYDHRIVDGREAVTFLVKIKELIEDPESLLLEG